jgi:peptidoglycan hydrolase-like protein with peptidoglycan-binding domain
MMSRKKSMFAVAMVAVSGAALGIYLRDNATKDASAEPVPAVVSKTTKVARRTLRKNDRYDGTLKYHDVRSLSVPPAVSSAGGAATRTVTGFVESGTVLRRGERFYSIDRKPTILFYGDIPMYRSLSTEVTAGEDILQLEQNLAALGYDPDGTMTIDDTFDWRTANAVKRWEEDLGIEEPDKIVDQSQVVFVPGEVVVKGTQSTVGASVNAGTPLMDIVMTQSERRVEVTLDLDKQDEMPVGSAVRVTIPGQNDVAGTVRSVGTVASSDTGKGATSKDATTTTVVIAITGNVTITQLQTPVDVHVETPLAENVLTVPVAALVALVEGGFAVEVPDGASSKLVAVTTGEYADNFVELRSEGIVEGTEVLTP